MIVCGFPRSGTSLLLLLLQGSVTNMKVKADREHKTLSQQFIGSEEVIIKGPHLLMQKPHKPLIIVRDPRSVITSRMGSHTANREGDYFCGMVDCKGRKARSQGVLQMGWVLMEYMTHKRKGMIIRYEDLVSMPDIMQRDIESYFKLEFDRKWSEFPNGWNESLLELWDHKLNGSRPLDNGHDWRHHLPRVRSQFKEHPEMQELLCILGYEKDDSWLDDYGIPRPHWMVPQTESEGVKVAIK